MGKGGLQVFLTFLGSSVLKQWSLPLLHCMRSEREREREVYLHFSYKIIQIFAMFYCFSLRMQCNGGSAQPWLFIVLYREHKIKSKNKA